MYGFTIGSKEKLPFDQDSIILSPLHEFDMLVEVNLYSFAGLHIYKPECGISNIRFYSGTRRLFSREVGLMSFIRSL
jgi:hypothetical protein